MGIYHCNFSNCSRAKGSCSTATLSYITAEKVYDERLNKTFQYGRAERVVEHDICLPDGIKMSESQLMNGIEKHEKSIIARTAKKIEVALPRELDLDKQREIVKQFIAENLTSRGYGCVYAIHDDPEHHNPHAHILVANRQLEKDGTFVKAKTRKEYELDKAGNRIPIIDKKTGEQKLDARNRKQWKRINVQVNPLDEKKTLETMRESWAKTCNQYLEPEQQIDHRSLKEQGIERTPQIHEGYAAREIENRGGISERCEVNRTIKEQNKLVASIKQLQQKFTAIMNQWKEQLYEKQRRNRIAPKAGASDRRSLAVEADGAIAERKNRDAERERQRIAEVERAARRREINERFGEGPDLGR